MTDLITLSDYKISQGITSLQHDTRLTSLIASVSQLVKTYCNTTFVDYYTNTKTDLFNISYNRAFVQLSECPIRVDTTPVVSERGSITELYTTLTENVDYYVDRDLDSIYKIGANWPIGPGAVKVVYNAGYLTIPADLQLAVIDLITYYHKDEHKTRQTIAGASIQNQSTTSQRDNVGFPDHIKRVLDLYKNF